MPVQVPNCHHLSWVTARKLVACATIAGAIAVSPEVLAQSAPATSSPSTQTIPAWQTEAGGTMQFEVASVRPAAPGASWRGDLDLSVEDSPLPPGGRFSATATLGAFLQFAYKVMLVDPQQDTGLAHLPKWVASEFFDIEAKAPMPNPTKDQMRLMMQALLADRFKLAAHFASRDVPVLALVLVKPGKRGPRLRPHSEGPACDATIPPVDRSSPKIPDVWIPVCGTTQMIDWSNHTVILGSRNTAMDVFAEWIPLIEPMDRPVVNQTGLSGRFDIEVNFTPEWTKSKEQGTDASIDLSGPGFLEALKDQLGLKLASTRAPVPILIVDHVELPSPN